MIYNAIEEELFLEVSDRWNLELLYQNLAEIKQINLSKKAQLTPVEKAMLRGLLGGYSPKEIASKLHWTSASVGVELSKGIYRYLEILTNRESNSLKSWHNVAKWMEEAGYKFQSSAQQTLFTGEELPEINQFYGRETELNRLQQWIVEKSDRLIFLSGMIGIGKTTLAASLIKQIRANFQCIIWRDLQYQSSLSAILSEILTSCDPQEQNNYQSLDINSQITILLNHFKKRKCLLILDGLENTMSAGEFAGFYQPEHQAYRQLIKRIAVENHQSCLLVISREELIDLPLLQGDKVDILNLQGLELAAKSILKNYHVFPASASHQLIYQYCGNPLVLKLVSAIIKELFNGNTATFLKTTQERNLSLFPLYFKQVLQRELTRLSKVELKVLSCLVYHKQPICFQHLQTDLSAKENNNNVTLLIQALNSLRRRSLITVVTNQQKTCICVNPIIKSYFLQEEYSTITKRQDNS